MIQWVALLVLSLPSVTLAAVGVGLTTLALGGLAAWAMTLQHQPHALAVIGLSFGSASIAINLIRTLYELQVRNRSRAAQRKHDATIAAIGDGSLEKSCQNLLASLKPSDAVAL